MLRGRVACPQEPESGCTALHYAATAEEEDVVELLVRIAAAAVVSLPALPSCVASDVPG